MKFQDSQVELRLRTPDEAIDVGVLLARKYCWALLGSWAIFAIPIFGIACFMPHTVIAVVFFWWFKPLYERLPLQVVSSAIFLQKHSVSSAFRGVFQYDTLAWLTIYRFCPGRSTLTPVAALEGIESGTGKIRRRRQLVKSPLISSYLLLHVGMFLGELILVTMGVILYMQFVQPVFVETMVFFDLFVIQWNWVWTSQSGKVLLLGLLLTSSAFIAPFYVCAGFGLYINRRIGLEGWDLYLGFQRLVARLSVMCVAFLILVPAIDVAAQEVTFNSPVTSQSHFRSEIDDTMREHVVREEVIREPRPPRAGRGNAWGVVMQIISYIIMGLLIASLIGLVIWVLIRLRFWEFVKKRSKKSKADETEVSIIADSTTEVELPSDVVANAKLAWSEGRARDALSLLYRGALLFLIAKHSCPIEICDTERICARVIARRVPTLSTVFNKLSMHWQQVAYGKKTLGDQEFRQLVSLYEDSFA